VDLDEAYDIDELVLKETVFTPRAVAYWRQLQTIAKSCNISNEALHTGSKKQADAIRFKFLQPLI
jgi:hypothetical protein